jgi:hypothetical protein
MEIGSRSSGGLKMGSCELRQFLQQRQIVPVNYHECFLIPTVISRFTCGFLKF